MKRRSLSMIAKELLTRYVNHPYSTSIDEPEGRMFPAGGWLMYLLLPFHLLLLVVAAVVGGAHLLRRLFKRRD